MKNKNEKTFWQSAEFWISISAATIALVSLIFSVTESRRSREHDRLSSIPTLRVTFWYKEDTAGFSLGNVGLGPGRLEWFQVLVDGEPQPNWRSMLENLGFDPVPKYAFIIPGNGHWWPKGYKRGIFNLEGKANLSKMKKEANRVEIVGCYSSIYDQNWIFSRSTNIPKEVHSCESKPDIKFSAAPPRN